MITIRIIAICLIITSASLKTIGQTHNYSPITQQEYLNYFPSGINGVFSYNTKEIVVILPTNEPDKEHQQQTNKVVKKAFETFYVGFDAYRKIKTITDVEALEQDLSDNNIIAVGTINGNLYTKHFLDIATDFPLQIHTDSIVGDTCYTFKDKILTAIWLNPTNKELPVLLMIPQDYKLLEKDTYLNIYGKGHCQYSIWDKSTQLACRGYSINKDKWRLVGPNERQLVERENSMALKTFKLTPEIETFIHQYPKPEELTECVITDDDISFNTLAYDTVSDNFECSDDLNWLKPMAKNYQIIALGEEHYRTYNGLLFERILFAANTFDYFPLLVMENAWSYGAYYNHYLSIKNNKKAEAYYAEITQNLPHQPIVQTIRKWNKQNPNKPIKIGFSDIEHNFKLTMDFILNPYLKKVDPKNEIPDFDQKEYQAYLEMASRLIEKAKSKNIIGKYGFQTPDYYYSVLENLKQSLPIKLNPQKHNDHSDRFKAMIRIMTDDIFLGKDINNGKAFLFGGREHFRTVFTEKDSMAIAIKKDFFRNKPFFANNFDKHLKTEGFYLANYHTPTKGKVFSIGMFTFANSIEDSVLRIPPNLGFKYEQSLIDAYQAGKLKLNQPVIGWSAEQMHQYIYKKSYEYPEKAFYVNNIKAQQIADKLIPRNRSLIKNLGLYDDYNACIFIPHSPIGPKMTTEQDLIELDIRNMVHKGQVNLDQKQWDKALEYFNKALAIDSNHYYAKHQKTRILLLLGRFEEAYALSQNLSDASSLLKGCCADVLGKRNEAIDYYLKTLETNASPTHNKAAKDLVKHPYSIHKSILTDSIYKDTIIDKTKWTVEVSSNSHEKTNCIDNDYNKRWTNKQNQRPGEYLIVDMNEIRVLNRIILIDDALGNSVYRLSQPNKYSIYISTDRSNWIKVGNGEGSILKQAGTVFEPHEARYIKVTQDGSTIQEWWSVYEIDAYEPKLD